MTKFLTKNIQQHESRELILILLITKCFHSLKD